MLAHYLTILQAAADGKTPDLTSRTVAKFSEPLRAAGYIRRKPGNGPYELTPDGRKFLPKVRHAATLASEIVASLEQRLN